MYDFSFWLLTILKFLHKRNTKAQKNTKERWKNNKNTKKTFFFRTVSIILQIVMCPRVQDSTS